MTRTSREVIIGRKRQPRAVAANNISRTLNQHHQRHATPSVHASDRGKRGFKVWSEPLAGGVRVLHAMGGRISPADAAKERQRETLAYAKTLRREGYFVRVDGEGIEASAFVYGHSWDEALILAVQEKIKPGPGEGLQRYQNRLALHMTGGLFVAIEVVEQIATVHLMSAEHEEKIGWARRVPEVMKVVRAARDRAKSFT